MKNYKEITAEAIANATRAKELEERADALYKKTEIMFAATADERRELRKSITEEDENEATKLYEEAEALKKKNIILLENARASFAEEAKEIIKNIMQKYSGKQYGEKTKEKAWKEAHAAGISFYFDGYRGKDAVKVYTMNPENGCRSWNGPEVTLYAVDADGKRSDFISNTNKIADFEKVFFSSHYEYTENPEEKRAEQLKAYEAYKEAYNAAKAAQDALNALLTGDQKRFDAIGHLSPWQTV